MASDILRSVQDYVIQNLPVLMPKMILTGTVIILLILIRFVLNRLIFRLIKNQASRFRARRRATYATVIVGLLVLFPVWLPNLQAVAAFLGIFGAGVVLVLKEVILNLAGWFYIILRRPFDIGNRITVAGYSGDVTDIRLFEFTMMEVRQWNDGGMSTGRVLHIPNSVTLTQPLANSSKEFAFAWNEIHLPLEPGSNWKRAVEILESIAGQKVEKVNESDDRIRQSEEQYAIRYKKMLPRVFVDFRHGEIILTLRHLVEPRTHRLVTDAIWRELLSALESERDIRLSRAPLPHA